MIFNRFMPPWIFCESRFDWTTIAFEIEINFTKMSCVESMGTNLKITFKVIGNYQNLFNKNHFWLRPRMTLQIRQKLLYSSKVRSGRVRSGHDQVKAKLSTYLTFRSDPTDPTDTSICRIIKSGLEPRPEHTSGFTGKIDFHAIPGFALSWIFPRLFVKIPVL